MESGSLALLEMQRVESRKHFLRSCVFAHPQTGEVAVQLSPDELELYRRAREGCQQSANILVERFTEHLLHVIRQHINQDLRSLLDSVDILQSAWTTVFCGPMPPEASLESIDRMLAYFQGVARYKTLKANRKYLDAEKRDLTREVPLDCDVPDQKESPEQVFAAKERWQQFEQSLPPQWQDAMRLVRAGHSKAETARELGIKEWALRRFVVQARLLWSRLHGYEPV
jgi:DNA-directed RNA polymerase specialized sigma24 family protein